MMVEHMNNKPQSLADPCIDLCVQDSNEDVCLGCGRTQAEINDWATFTNTQQEDILKQTAQRLEGLAQKRRKKRNARHRAKVALKNV